MVPATASKFAAIEYAIHFPVIITISRSSQLNQISDSGGNGQIERTIKVQTNEHVKWENENEREKDKNERIIMVGVPDDETAISIRTHKQGNSINFLLAAEDMP